MFCLGRMEERSISINTRIIRTSALWVVIVAIVQVQVPRTASAQERSDANGLIVRNVSAAISEESFWLGYSLPEREPRVVLYWRTDGSGNAIGNVRVLAIVPDLNATYEFQFCGKRLALQEARGPMLGPASQDSYKLAPDKYLGRELDRLSDFVSQASKSDEVLTLTSDPSTMFGVDAELKARRISQIQSAARELFHKRPLRMTIGDFSPFTKGIRVLIPVLNEIVMFNVVDYPCTTEETVSVGRVRRLEKDTTDKPFLRRIEAHSTVTTIR